MYKITVQRAVKNAAIPTSIQLRRWIKHALKRRVKTAELTLRITGKKEMTELNTTYRHKTGPTNVLSFPFSTPTDIEMETPFLGDVVICAEVVNEEAVTQKKSKEAHWAHIVVHGTLHLLGYDHEIEADAAVMEAQEVEILQSLGFTNPYHVTEKRKKS